MAIVLDGTTGITTPGINNSGTNEISSGNLTFTGTAQRITGDFSNATASNRVLFRTSTTNGNSFVGVTPNGTGSYGAYIAYNASDTANSSSLLQGITSTDARLVSTATGTGSFLPMAFYAGGSVRFQIGTAGQLGVGGANYGTATQVLTSNGPSAAPSWQNAASGAQDYIVQSYGIV